MKLNVAAWARRLGVLVVSLAASAVFAGAQLTESADPGLLEPEAMSELVSTYCISCHSDAAKTGGLSLESFDARHPELRADIAEKMLRKLNAGMMPPSFAMQPEPDELQALVRTYETRIDAAAAENPNPGSRSFQRLNRAEYARSVEDLLGLSVDVEALLPPDTISHSFDNIADVQTLSPTLMEAYLRAATKISREALGDRRAGPSEVTYKVPKLASQMRHVDGAPFGTRGGLSISHNFPADGEYVFKIQLHASPAGFLYGSPFADDEQLEVSLNGVRVALLDIDPTMTEEDPNGMNMQTEPVFVQAGPRIVSAAFLTRFEGPVDDVIAPIEHTLADTHIGIAHGITTLPHLRDFAVSGPYKVTGVSETVSRRNVFSCRPTTAHEEIECAGDIVERLAARAYRRPVDSLDLQDLMGFYEKGREKGDFEDGVRMALQVILASPAFVFRFEESPSDIDAGESYHIADLDLASRLSYFLWSAGPDDELVEVAREGRLNQPEVLEAQARRLLDDPRAETLATRFAAQWLRLQDVEKIHPDALMFPQYDTVLGESMKRETELLFDHLVREDRSLLEILTADYTFVNERLASHYEIPGVNGSHFRKVSLGGDTRQRSGVLGHGSFLVSTSVANRTSPVQRGKWVMEVLLGSPPPPPPPNVPALEETQAVSEQRALSVRERMEAHRANPACQSCHSVIDPLGLALENFDVTGAWRTKDGGPIDTAGELYDGTVFEGPLGLRDALVARSDTFVTTFTESLLTYALGRRVDYYDMPTVRAIKREAAMTDYRLSSFILGVVRSDAFQMAMMDDASTTEGY